MVVDLQRPVQEGKQRDDLNFSEALGAINAQLNDPEVPASVKEILSDPQCQKTDMDVSHCGLVACRLLIMRLYFNMAARWQRSVYLARPSPPSLPAC